MNLSQRLAVASADLRRISNFAYGLDWSVRKPVIEKFLESGQRVLSELNTSQLNKFDSRFDLRRQDFKDLIKIWSKGFRSSQKRLVWCESALTLSLRLQHLSKSLS